MYRAGNLAGPPRGCPAVTRTAPPFRSLLPLVLLLSGCTPESPETSSLSDAPSGLPIEFLAGSYDVVGRRPGSDQTYSGTMVLAPSDSDASLLSITRTIGQVSTSGTGSLQWTEAQVQVLRISFEDGVEPMEATYLIVSDLDNYPRMTGYVYRREGDTAIPGLEVLFSDHYRRD